jgi:hypothetical protein
VHLGRVLEMAESSPDKQTNETKIVQRFGGQHELELVIPPQPSAKLTTEAAQLMPVGNRDARHFTSIVHN